MFFSPSEWTTLVLIQPAMRCSIFFIVERADIARLVAGAEQVGCSISLAVVRADTAVDQGFGLVKTARGYAYAGAYADVIDMHSIR